MWLRRTVLTQGSQGPDGACPPTTLHHPELSAATARSDYPTRVERARDDPWVIVPARRLLLRRPVGLPSINTGAVRGALRGGVKAPPVCVARRRRAAAAAVPAAAPFSPPHVSPATATWLYVPPCALAAM